MIDIPSPPHKYLHALLSMSLLIELIDDLEGTEFYRLEVKRAAKAFMRSIKPYVDHEMMVLCNQVNGKAITGMMIDHEQLMKEISSTFTSHFPVITAILQQYKKDPEFVLKQLDITIEINTP